MILQRVYQPVLNFIYDKLTCIISQRVRITLMTICFFIIFVAQILVMYGYHIGMGISGDFRDCIIGALMALIIVLSVDRKLELQKWKWWMYVSFIGTALMILVAGRFHYVGESYTLVALFMLIECICLYFVWSCRGDYDTLFKSIAVAYLSLALIIFVYALVNEPYVVVDGYDSYSIMGINPNGFCKIVAPAVICSIYLMMISVRPAWRVIFGLMAGLSVYFLYATQARMGTIIIALTLIVFIIWELRQRRNIKSTVTVMVAVIIAIFGTGIVLTEVTPAMNDASVKEKTETIVQQQEDKEIRDAEDDAIKEQQRGTTEYAKRLGLETIGDNELLLKLNDFSTGRVVFWAAYLSNMNFIGHDHCILKAGAHNTYIEYAYRGGLLTGVFWLLFVIFAMVMIIKEWLIKGNILLLFTTLAFIVYFTMSMLDTGYIPLERGFAFMFFVSFKDPLEDISTLAELS